MGNERPTMALPNQVDERFSHDSEHPLHPTRRGQGALVPDQTSRGAGRSLVAPGRSLCTTTGSDATGITLDEWGDERPDDPDAHPLAPKPRCVAIPGLVRWHTVTRVGRLSRRSAGGTRASATVPASS
jgi:hypothetical protein